MLSKPRYWLFGIGAVIPSIVCYAHAYALVMNNYPYHLFGEHSWLWSTGLGALREDHVVVYDLRNPKALRN